MKGAQTLFILLPLLCQGLEAADIVEQPVCDLETRRKYCDAEYGGDLHTGCKYCGLGPQCPQGVTLSGRGLKNRPDLRDEILRRHNEYRADVRAGLTRLPATNCIPDLSWDEELAEVAQIWADQCANVIYFHNSDMYPRIFHERGFERTTSRFNSPPGVGQNVAWALTKHVNFTRIIDDLWYRDINKLQPGRIGDFQVDPSRMDTNLVTQILWGRTTHVGCGWTQFPLLEGSSKFEGIYAEGEYENFFVCNYGVGGNVPGEPVYNMECFEEQQDSSTESNAVTMLNQMEIKFKDGFNDASELEKQQINVCLDTLTCLTQQSSADKSCSQLEFQCVIAIPPKFPDTDAYFQSEFVQERIAQIECKIEALLCAITPNQDCASNLENCLLDYDYYDVDYDLTMTEKPSRKDETTLRTLSRDKTTLRDLFTNFESTTLKPASTTTLRELFPDKPITADASLPGSTTRQTTERLQLSDVVTSVKSSTTEKIVSLPNAFTEPSTTIRLQPRTEDSQTNVETTTKKVVVLLTTTRPVVIQSSTSSMTGSTSLDIDEITTQLPKMDVELTTVRPATATRPAATTLLSTTKSEVAKTTQKQDQFQTTTLKEEQIQSTEKSTELRKSTRKEDEILPQTTTLRSNLLDFLANNMETTTMREEGSSSPIQMSELLEMIMKNQTEDLKILGENDFDVSFYNSTSKTSFRLAVCLDGITCEASPRCTLVHTKCNEGMDVSGIPHRVRQKLSECSVDDILCHLNANPNVLECQRTFEKCVKIVVPAAFLPMVFSETTSLPTEDTTLSPIEDTTPTLDPVSILGGLASMTQKENDVLNELTSNVLSAIQNSTEGFTIEPLVGNFSIADLLESNETLPVFQDFIILLNDTSNINETAIEDPSLLDLSNANIIFNPATLSIGDDKTIINPRLNQTLRENIINAVKDFATVCTVCNSTTEKPTTLNDLSNQADPQVQLAVCLKGVECEDPETCKKAQKLCLGEEIFINFNDEQRKQLSECYIDNYLCILKSSTDEECEKNLKQCLSMKATDFAQKGVITIDEIISQVAGDISNIITEEEVDDQDQEIVISGINEPVKEEGTVSINLNSTDGPIILTSSTPVVKFDEVKNTVTVKVDKKELEGKETEERKEITKERIEEALRQIFILSQPVAKPKPDETSLAHIIASTISGYIKESDKDVPSTIGIAVETKKDLDVPEVDILAEEEDTFVTIVKLPGETDQKVEFTVPINVKEGQDNVDIEELADDISEEFDQALLDQDQPPPVSEIVSTAVTEYVEASGEKPDKVIVKIEKNSSVEIPSLEIETESTDTLKTTLTLPSTKDSTEEFEVDLDQSPNGTLNLDNLETQIDEKLEDKERQISTTPRSIVRNTESIENLAKDVAEAIKKAAENQDPPKQISIAYQGHSDGLQGPEFMVRGSGDVLLAIIEKPSENNFTERVDITIDDKTFDDLEDILNETFQDIEASNSKPTKDVTQIVVEMVEEAIENREIPADVPARVTITVETDDSLDVPEVELEDMDRDRIKMNVVIPSGGTAQPKEKVVIEVPLNQNPDFEKEVSEKLNEIVEQKENVKPPSDLLTEISEKVNEFIAENDMKLPDEIIVNVESKNDIKETEITVENEGGKVTTVVKIPDENEKFFEFNIPTQSITGDQGDTLAKDKLEVALKDNLAQVISSTESPKDDEQPNLADFIADTIGQFIDDTSIKTPEKTQIEVETQKGLTSPEIELEPVDSGDLKTTIKLPGEENQSVNFEVPIEVSAVDKKVDRTTLSSEIANGFDEALEKGEAVQKTEDNLPGIIASTTADFIEDNDKVSTTSQINVNIETDPDLTSPKIEVEDIGTGIKTTVRLPGDREESTEFTIPTTSKDKVDVEALSDSIASQLDSTTLTSTLPTITSTQVSRIETISEQVTDAIEDLSRVQTTPKIVNVDVQPASIQEPSVTISSTTEDGSIVKATVQVPKDGQDILPVAIAVPQEVASGGIDKTTLNDRITTMLTSSTPPTTIKVESNDIAETVAEAINEIIEDKKEPPKNVKLNVTFNEEILEPQVEIEGIDEDVVLANVQVPGDNDKPDQVIEVPLAIDSSSKVDREQLENEFTDKLEEVVSFGTTTNKPKTLAEEISNSIIDKVETTDEQPPMKATINIEDSVDTKVEIGSIGVEDIEIMVKTPVKQKEQVQVDIPIKDGTTKEIDKEKLSRRIEDALNEASVIVTTTSSVTSKDDFILSIDKFGITVGTLTPQDVVVTTIKSIIEDISESVTTEDMSDVMSVSEFGFTISAPSKDSTTRKNDRIEDFGEGSTTTRKNDRLEDFIGPTETSVPRPDLNDIDDSKPTDDKRTRPTTTLRSLDTSTFAVDVSPSYSSVSSNVPSETTTARLIDKSTIRDESGIKVTLTFSTESTPAKVEPSIAEQTTKSIDQETSTARSSTTTEASSFFSGGILDRVRDITIALIAGLIAQYAGFTPFAPVNKNDENEGDFIPFEPKLPNVVAKDPFVRNKVQESEGAYDGSIFNLTIPIKPEEIPELQDEKIRQGISTVVKQAIGSDNITVTFGNQDEEPSNLVINAQGTGPLDTRPKTPRLDDKTTTKPKIENQPPPEFRFVTSSSRPPTVVPPRTLPPFVPSRTTTTTRPPISQGGPTRAPVVPQVFTTSTTVYVSPTEPSRVQFELTDAITSSTSTTTDFPLSEYVPYDDNEIPLFIPPLITQDQVEEILDSVPVDENRIFDSRLNFLGESSVNVVEATVVEDLNYARSVRESASTLGIATISSITVGVIALLAFSVLIIMALARRRRRRKYDTTAASSAAMTPTQSRTTFSGTPIMADTPSVSGGFGEDPLNTTGSSTIEPVVHIDGHQTIISSYNEFMSLPNESRNNIMNNLPSPTSEGSETNLVPRTQNLIENSPFLFAPSLPTASPGDRHYP